MLDRKFARGDNTLGLVSHVEENLVAVGDTLFASSIGRSDLWGGDYKTLIQSIRERLLTLDQGMRVLPGHGPETTIGREAKFNPFLTGRSFL